MSEHTPGPWRVGRPGTPAVLARESPYDIYQDKEYSKFPNDNPSQPEDGCIVGYTTLEEAGVVRIEDARLIAAAPELLAVMQRTRISVYGLQQGYATDHQEILDRLDAAIAKATEKE